MNLLIRTDGGATRGTGHVMRCLALAQAWQAERGTVSFLVAADSEEIIPCLRAENFEVSLVPVQGGTQLDADRTAELALRLNAQWVVLDGYHFDAEYQRKIVQAGQGLVCIDDSGRVDHYWASWVVNQNLHAAETVYKKREPYTRLLLGPRYALLRREFCAGRSWTRDIREWQGRILLTLGGGDSTRALQRILGALSHWVGSPLHLRTLAGFGTQACIYEMANPNVQIESAAIGSQIHEHMAWADLAISGAGSTVWELSFSGTPALLLVLADNQTAVAASLHEHGSARNLGPVEDLTPALLVREMEALAADSDRRAAMSRLGQTLVDGLGASRIANLLKNPPSRQVFLRDAEAADCRMIWEWANETETRAASFSPDPIGYAEHAGWFARMLAEPSCRFFILSGPDGEPRGQVRFDLSNGDAVVSVSLGNDARGKGFGTAAIRHACDRIFAETATQRITAYIKPSNRASVAAFKRAWFEEDEKLAVVRGQAALRLLRKREWVI